MLKIMQPQEAHLHDFTERCASIARMHSVGASIGGARLWVLVLADEQQQAQPRPAFRYIGNMHGDEPSGRQLLLGLAEWLCARWVRSSSAFPDRGHAPFPACLTDVLLGRQLLLGLA